MDRSFEGIRISAACYTPCCLSSGKLYEVGEGEEEGPIASASSSSSAPILLWVLKLKLDLLLLLPPPRPPIAPNLQRSHRFPYICEDKLSAREMEILSISHNEISLSVSSRNSRERSGGHPYSPPICQHHHHNQGEKKSVEVKVEVRRGDRGNADGLVPEDK